jgi:TMEM175 potassium channel family protein
MEAVVAEPGPEWADRPGFKKDRVLSLQDAIFGVAMTLLALDLRVPEELSHAQVRERFVELVPAIAVFAAAFVIIGVVWLFVYSFEEMVPKLDIPGASLLLLACAFVVLLPFTSAAFAHYAHERISEFAFVANILLVVATYTVYAEYAARRLIPSTVDRGFLRTVRHFLWLQVVLSAAAGVFWSQPKVLLLWCFGSFTAAYIVLLTLHDRFVQASRAAEHAPVASAR